MNDRKKASKGRCLGGVWVVIGAARNDSEDLALLPVRVSRGSKKHKVSPATCRETLFCIGSA
jgi:hypothetical protein